MPGGGGGGTIPGGGPFLDDGVDIPGGPISGRGHMPGGPKLGSGPIPGGGGGVNPSFDCGIIFCSK